MGWTQDNILCSIDKSLQQIFQHLENASSTLRELNFPESHDASSSSSISDIVAQEGVPPCCYCKNGKRSSDYSTSSESSNNSSILSYLPIIPESTIWQTQSNSPPDSLEKESPMSRTQSTPLPAFQLTDTEKSDLFPNFAVLPPVQNVPSIHLHVNIGVNSEVNKTEVRMSQPLTSNKQLESENDHQIIRYIPLVLSMDASSSRNVEVNVIQEESSLLQKEPKLNKDQEVISLPEEMIQPHKAQGTNVELTPNVPCSDTDSIKVTPKALLRVMDSMGLIPDSHSEAINSVGKIKDKTDLSQPSNRAETVNIPPESSNPVIESIKVPSPEHQMRESKSMASRPNQITDISKVTPVELSNILDSRGLINELHSHVIESAGIAPKPHYQVMESVGVHTLQKHQTAEPAKMSLGPHHTVFKAGERILQPQHKATEELNMDSGSQNQATKQIRFTPSSFQPPQIPSKVLDSSRMVPEPSEKSICALKGNSVVQGSPTGVVTPLQDGLTAQAKESPELPFSSQVQVSDCIGMTPHQGTENVSLTPKLPHQVKNPLEFTPGHEDLDCSEVSPRQNDKLREPMGLTSDTWPQREDPTERTPSKQQVPEATVTSHTCDQVEEPAELTQSSVGMTPAPLSQTSESMEMSLPPLQDTLETMTQVVKEMKETPELQTKVKDILNLLPELEVPTINPEVMAPEPQLLDVDFAHVTPEPCSEVTNPSQISLYEYTGSTELTLLEVDDTQGTTVETCSEMGPQGLNLESRMQIEESESLAEKLKFKELTSEPPVLVAETKELTTEPTPHIIDVIPEPQLHNVKSMQVDTGLDLQSELSVDSVQQSSIGVVDPEKAKPEPGPQSVPPKESVEETQIPNVKSVDFNLDQEPPIVKSGLTPGPQLQSVKFPTLYQGLLQGENPENSILGPPHYSVKSDEAISYSPMPEIRSSGFISGPKLPEPQPQHVKSMEVNLGPCLQDVRFSDSIPKPKLHSFKYTQFTPGLPLPERTSQVFMPESFLPLSQEPKFKDRKLALPTQGSEFHSMKFATQVSELQRPCMISKEVNIGPQEQDTKFSELASRPKLQGVKFGEQISGSMFVGGGSKTPELGMYDPKLAKMTPGLQNTRQVGLNSGPWLQDVKFLDVIPGTQLQGVKTSELNLGPQLEHLNISELTTQPERQEMKLEVLVQESPFQDIKYVTGNQASSFEDKMFYKTVSEPQVPTAVEAMKLASGRHLANADHSELIRRPQTQGIAPSELTEGQLLGHIKPVENTVSKQEALTSVELTPGLALGDIKSTKLKSEPEHIRSMLSTPGMQAGNKKLELSPGSSLKGLKPRLLPSKPKIEDRKSVILTIEECLKRIKSTVVSPSSSPRGGMKSVKLIPGSRTQNLKNKGLARGTHVQDVNAMGLKLEPKKQGESPVTFVPRTLFQEKSMEVFQGPQLQGTKPKELTSQSQMQDRKPVITSCLKQQSLKPVTVAKTQEIRGVKFVDLTSTQQGCQGMAPMDLTLKSRQDDQIIVKSLERKSGIFDQQKKELESENTLPMESDQEPKPADMKPIEINSKLQFKGTTSFELAPELVVQSVKAEEFQNELQAPSMKPFQLTPVSQVHQEKALESTLEPQLQGVEAVAQNKEPQIGSTKSIQWIPISEFLREKGIGSDSRSQTQGARPTALTPPVPWRGVRSSKLTATSIQGEKSVALHPEPQLQGVKTSPIAIGLQESKTFNLTSEPQPQGITTEELNKEPQAENVRSVQWIPQQEFPGVKFLGSNNGSPFQGVKGTEQKPSIKLGGEKPSEMTQGPKLQGTKTGDFNLRPQEHCVKTLQLSPEPELQKGGNFASSSEPQSQCVETVSLHHGPQLENTKSVFQDKKSMQNLGLQPQGIISKELKPSVQERDVKTSEELMTRPKSEGKEPSGSAQGCLSHGFKTIDYKSKLPFKSMKACDPILKSTISNIKPMTFKPRFHIEDRKSNELTPGIQPQEAKPLKSSLGIQQPQDVASSVLKQESHSSESKSGVLGQGSQSQNNESIGLKSEKSSELALQTKPQGMKSEMKSEPQRQTSDLTPETKSQNMELKLRPSLPLKSKSCTNLIMGTKIQGVKLDCKPGPQSQGIKSDSILKTKPQEMEMEDCESGPQLQDLKSLRRIMGVKVQDVKSMSFSPRPHLEGTPSEVIPEKNVNGMKPEEIKPSPKLQGEKPESTPRKLFLGTRSIRLDSGLYLQDLKYPELTMGMKHQGVDSMEQHLTSRKPSEVITQINSQGVTAVGFDSGPQTQNKRPSELFQGEKLQDMESKEFNQNPKLHSMTVESIPETKPQYRESVKLNSGPQLQDEYFTSILGTKLQDGRSPEVNSGPHLQGVNFSEGISGDTVPKEEPMVLVYQPLGQNEESCKWIFSKALDGKPLHSKVPSELQDRKLSKLKPELNLQGMKPEAFNPILKLEDVQANSINPQTTNDKEVNYDANFQVGRLSELASTIYNVVPSGLNARNQKQDGKPQKLSQKQQVQSIKSTLSNHEPHLQHIKSSDLFTKLQDLKSVEFNSEQQLQDVTFSELGLETSTQSLGFNPGPQLQEIKLSVVSTEVKLLEESPLELEDEPRLHCRKSCSWSHNKNVMAPNTKIQDVGLSELHPGPELQGIKAKVFFPGSHLEDVNSAYTPNINFQYVNSSECISGPYLQDTNSSACIPEPNTQYISSEYNLGIHLHGMNSSSCFSGSKLQCVDSTGSNPESHLQDVNSTERTPESTPQCANSSACTPEPSSPCVNSTECNPESHLQGVNSFVYAAGQNPLCENSNRYNLGPLFQGNVGTFPPPQILCVNPVWCNTRIHLQDINSPACTLSQESQSVNSIDYNPGPHLQTPKHQEQHLKYLKSELTPGSNNLGIAPMEYKRGPLGQDMNSSEFNPESKPQCISSVKPSSGPQLRNIKSFELNSGSESQSTKSVLLNSGSLSQGVDSPNLMRGAKFQTTPILKNLLGSRQQSSQPVCTLRPQSNSVNSVVLPMSPPEERKLPEKSTQTSFCAIEPTSSCGLNDSRNKMFSPEPCFQNVQTVQLKPASQSPSVSSSELMSCQGSKLPMSSLAPKPCFQDTNPKQLRIGSKQQSLNGQLFPPEEKPMMVLAPESTRKLLAGPALTSVKFSNLSLKPQQQNTKSLAFASEPKCQGVKQVKLSSVSVPEPGKSVESPPKSILRDMKSGNLMPQTTDPVTKPTEVLYRPERQVVDFAEMSMKPRCQVPKSVNFTSPPIYQDVGSLEMTKGLEHKNTEMMEESMRLSSKPTDKVMESLEMSHLQEPEFFDLTPTLSDQDSQFSELSLQKSYQIQETPELHSWSWPPFKDFKKLQIKKVTESERITLNVKNPVADMIELTCEARQQGKEFLRMTPEPVNTETGFVEKSPRLCQDIGPLGVGSKKTSQREQSVISTPRPFCHIPDSASGITPGPGPQIAKLKKLASMLWLQNESSELSYKQTSQVEGKRDSVELTFGTQQSGEVAAKLTKPQNLSLKNANITLTEPLDQTINFVGISPKPRDQVTESAKTQLLVPQSVALPKVPECVEVVPGPPFQVIKSVMIPKITPQKSKYNDLTPKIPDMISSEFAPGLGLQNVQYKKLIKEQTHQVLETKKQTGFRIIKTVLTPKPLVLMVKSEEVAPGPCPQAVEPIELTTRSSIKVKECLNLHPRSHLQDLVKPMELTPRADIQMTSAELIFQQTFPLKEPTVLSNEQRLQAEKSIGLKTESPKVMKIKDSNQGSVCLNKDSAMITSAKLQEENYLSSFIHSPSVPFLSSVDKTTELGHLPGSGVPEVSRAFGMENLDVGILQSSKSYTDTLIIKSSVLPLVLQNLPSDKTGDTKGTPYPDIWSMDLLSKEESEKERMEEFQRYSSYSLRLLSEEFQEGLGTRRSSIRSFLGIQQNVWESHVSRQRLPRRYLSNMLMLGNVLGTTMERKPCSQSFLTEGSTMDICQSIQNLFGVPAELMEFSQSLLERLPRTISQTSVVKNLIQRHTLCHSNEKKMPLKMWTRGSTSSIIQQYSGTRLGVKKTSSKLSDIFQEATEHVSISCTGAGFPALIKSESTLEMLYGREDSVSKEQSKISPCGSLTRSLDSQHSLKTSSLSQSNTDIYEQSQLLKELRLKIAGKLLRSQIPHNVPPPLASGLVLKYPICLQCGRCSGFKCCHKLKSAMGPHLLVYPQLHLLSTPEGHGEVRLHLGFRLRTGKRSQVSKYHARNQADPQKGASSPSRSKDRFSMPTSKSPSSRNDFQSRSSLSPASVQVHTQQKQWHRHNGSVAGKPAAKDYEFYQGHSISESEYESTQDERGLKSSFRKTSVLTYTENKISQEPKTQNNRLYNINTTTKGNLTTLRDLPRNRTETTQTSTVSTKRQPKKSFQPKFIHLLVQDLRQAFQAALRIGQKKDYGLMGDSKGARTPVVRQRPTSSTPKQKGKLQGASECCRQAQQPKQNSTAKKSYEIPSLESKNCSKIEAQLQAQERIVPNPLLKGTLQSHFEKKPQNMEDQQGFFRESTLFNKPPERTHDRLLQRTHQQNLSERRHRSRSQRRHSSPSDRTLKSLSERSRRSLSQRNSLSSSVRTYHSLSDRSHNSLFKGRGHSPSRRSPRSPSRRSPWRPSRRSPRSPSRRTPRSPSRKSPRCFSRRNSNSPLRRYPQNPSWSSHHSLRRPSGRSPHRHLGRSPHRLSGRSPHRLSGRSPHRRSGRSPHRRSGRSPHRRSGRSPCRPLERRGRSPSVKKSLSGRRQQSPSLRRLSSSKRSHFSLTQRSVGSHSDSFSERSFSILSGWKGHSSRLSQNSSMPFPELAKQDSAGWSPAPGLSAFSCLSLEKLTTY
ncbi:uncharacterized protein LOC116076034 isoform X2 [Mastomys coucha]|nr:uncharacterized protein LOC116076034 isoform X2 [Mastomys coucha]XP_031205449.1 uncharacterized protein LOC116076034 isoform X2 [Mastomys coucha]XP_031205451.1 uncharacterized protein LOC116076034 isoform X2 [Mastomys coucha]XP_031205452.1 uncharacterized protein LOC116076034 isoform X2 [Mastomys coucha]XP_031205453.1 uncharacterized protein LOC116076034 isoform X2 [Mastomys coucha]XP_031205454.1 uncharacterized protein LOC116076034 isoform X2 [Mastomys coucha]